MVLAVYIERKRQKRKKRKKEDDKLAESKVKNQTKQNPY